VRSGLLIEGGQVRFAAGLFPSQGAYQFALDADTGQLLSKGQLKFSPQGYLRRQGSNLTSPAGRSPQVLLGRLTQSGKIVSPSLGQAPEKHPYAHIGTADLRLAGGDGEVAVLRADGGEPIDTLEVKGKAYGLAVAGGSLFVSTDEGCVYCFRHGGTGDDSPVEYQEPSLGEIWPEPLVDSCLAAAERIAAQAQDKQGYCLVYGSGDGCLAYWLTRLTDFKIVGIEPDADKVAQSRDALALATQQHVPIHHGRLDKLLYGSAIFNLVVSETALTSPIPCSMQEVMRVLKPGGGVACIGRPETAGDSAAEYGKQLVHWVGNDGRWQLNREKGVWAKFERPALANAGHWTHIYAEPGNTASSGDELVRPPFLLQWFGGPGPQDMVDRHHRSVPPLFCNGRVFIPGNDKVFALDAYNGAPLWDADIPKFRRIAAMRDTGNMAATPDRLFVAAGDECRVFAADTGKQVDTHDAPAGADDSPRDWGYVAVVGDRLYGSTTRPGASRGGHSRAAIDGAYSDRRPIVTSMSLFCKDRRKGGLAWQYRAAAGAILNPTITIGDGCVYFVESANPATVAETSGRSTPDQLLAAGACLVALDAQTGRERWRREADFRAVEHHLYLAFARQRLVAVGSRNHRVDGSSKPTVWYDVHAFNAADGTPLWKQSQDNRQGAGGDHGEQDHHPAIVGDTVYVEPKAYDLTTGRPIDSWRFARGGHGCGTISACPGALFFRAGNPTMCDLVSGEKTRLTHVTRPGCWINIIPAGGLILIPEASSGCTCNFGVQTSLALIPASLERGNDGIME
jgi:outer membrane protein assembly factor BamB